MNKITRYANNFELKYLKGYTMAKRKDESTCSVTSCGEKAKRSFSLKSIQSALVKSGINIEGTPKRVHLCDKHYKAIKKELKKEKKTELMRHGLPF